MTKTWTFSEQDGPPGKCLCAQVWDENGKSIAIIEPTEDPQIANQRAFLFASSKETADERDQMFKALIEVELWWLNEGMKKANGAPFCMFKVRELLDNIKKETT